jgi:hypothetical protein
MDPKIHKRRLQLQGFEEGEISMALSRVEIYAEYNRTHPGFFDAFISTSMKIISNSFCFKYLFSFLFYR